MKILIVASYNKGSFSPFVVEQADALKNIGNEIALMGIKGRSFKGYLKNYSPLRSKIDQFRPDVIHAHYGLSGLFANMQRRVPVVTTYHGSDINDRKVLPFSRLAMCLSAWNVFVSRKTMEIAKPKRCFSLVPCGIDLCGLQLTSREEARKKMGLSAQKQYVLFAGAFNNGVKNAPLAKGAVNEMRSGAELLELKGYSREEVTLLMCAADALLMTSLTEGSPQVVKEALDCGCPIVSVDVGDVSERIDGVAGCFLARTSESSLLASLLDKAIAFEGKTDGRGKIIADGLDNQLVERKLMDIYKSLL